jgi:hypothetical protein
MDFVYHEVNKENRFCLSVVVELVSAVFVEWGWPSSDGGGQVVVAFEWCYWSSGGGGQVTVAGEWQLQCCGQVGQLAVVEEWWWQISGSYSGGQVVLLVKWSLCISRVTECNTKGDIFSQISTCNYSSASDSLLLLSVSSSSSMSLSLALDSDALSGISSS